MMQGSKNLITEKRSTEFILLCGPRADCSTN